MLLLPSKGITGITGTLSRSLTAPVNGCAYRDRLDVVPGGGGALTVHWICVAEAAAE